MKSLAEYKRKRNFKKTSEPEAKVRTGKSTQKNLLFVVQEHHASHLHYDFRLEWKGVLKSWAVPKGPSLDPAQKRLAVEVEDHPYDYWKFEGTIPAKEYGAGEVFRWDYGTWIPVNDFETGMKKGRLEIELKGKKLKGNFLLVRTGRQSSKPNWLMIKRHDKYAEDGAVLVPVADYGSGKTRGAAKVEKAAKVVKAPQRKKKAELPEFTPPQLAQLVNKPPKGAEWLHEIKFDGYRIQAHVAAGEVTLYTRNGHNWTAKYRALAKALKDMDVENAVFDGEIVYQDESGRSNFQKLQNAMKSESTQSLIFYIFDLLFLDGEDLRERPLIERKEKLEELIGDLGDEKIRYSEHFKGVGDKMIEASCSMDLEGIICKKADSGYTSGRRGDWVKVKCIKRQEFVIGGFTDPEGSRFAFGSLLLGFYENGKLKYAGRCGSGFDGALLREINKKLRKLETPKSPFVLNAPKERGLHYVKPELACEVSYAEMTEGGHLRAPVFKGLRSDKAPGEITIEKPKEVEAVATKTKKGSKTKTGTSKTQTKTTQKTKTIKAKLKAELKASPKGKKKAGSGVHVTHPDRVIYPKEKITKLQVAEYYKSVSPWILPHLAGRPISMLRCQQSAVGMCFFAKHMPKMPDSLTAIPDTEGKEPWVGVDSEEGLMHLVQLGTLEIHPWGSEPGQIDSPNMIIMDFDPEEGLGFDVVKEGALEMRDILKQLGLKSYLKTTGGKGLHVVFPFEARYDWDSVKSFAKTLTQEMVSRHPDLYTANMSKKLRKGKIFLDYLRNGRGATAVSPYSLRARAQSAVAMPIEWSELAKLKAANTFTLPKALEWLATRKKDPWADFFKVKQKISLLK